MPAVSLNFSSPTRRTFFSILILLFFWAGVWIANASLFPRLLGWDEILYLSEAKGIAQDSDYSARQLNTLGILKFGFPTHLANYPIFSSILGGVFALFGTSLPVAHAMNWIAALGVILALFGIGRRLGFGYIVSIVLGASFLLTPGVMRHVDTVMMETVGAFLLSLFVLFLMSRLGVAASSGKTAPAVALGIALLVLWLFKTLFVGVLVGIIVYVMWFQWERTSFKLPQPARSLGVLLMTPFIIFGSLGIGYIAITSAVFLPLAPQFVYDPAQLRDGAYGEFAGGFFKDTRANLARSIRHIADQMSYHGVYRGVPTPYSIGFLTYVRYYFFILASSLIFLAATWKTRTQAERRFAFFATASLISFYIILNIIIRTVPENVHRYSIYYLPLYLPLIAIALRAATKYISDFAHSHRFAARTMLALILLVFWAPLFLTFVVHQVALEKKYNRIAAENHSVITTFLGASRPGFIYFTHGTHTTFLGYPTRQIALDATTDELLQVNRILPEPVQFLFLRPPDSIYREHEADILSGKRILESYVFRGSRPLRNSETVVFTYEYAGTASQ